MTVRRAALADATDIKALWDTALSSGGLAFWEQATGETLEPLALASIQRTIQHPAEQVYVDYVGNDLRGFFITRPERLLEFPEPAERLVIWMVKPGIPPGQFRQTLTRLFSAWADEVIARGATWIWGTIPSNSPPGSVAFLTAWGPAVETDPVTGWPVYYYEATVGRGRL